MPTCLKRLQRLPIAPQVKQAYSASRALSPKIAEARLGTFQWPTSLAEYSNLHLMREQHCKQMAQGNKRIINY
jgi:hypothetical protein